jgi:hypothetical protein
MVTPGEGVAVAGAVADRVGVVVEVRSDDGADEVGVGDGELPPPQATARIRTVSALSGRTLQVTPERDGSCRIRST